MITKPGRIAAIAATAVMLASVDLAFAQFDATRSSSLDISTLALGPAGDPAATSGDGCTTVTIAWASASGADSYAIEVRRDLGTWTTLTDDAGPVASVEDTTSSGSAQVEYRITPMHVSSGWSGPMSTTAPLTCA